MAWCRLLKRDPQEEGTSKPFCNAERQEKVWVIYYFPSKIQLFCSLEGSSKSQSIMGHVPEQSEEKKDVVFYFFIKTCITSQLT